MLEQAHFNISGQYLLALFFLASVLFLFVREKINVKAPFGLIAASAGLLAISEILFAFRAELPVALFQAGYPCKLTAYLLLCLAVARMIPSSFRRSGMEKAQVNGDTLENEREFISTVLDSAGALVIVLDRNDRIVRCNKTCEYTTGFMASEMHGRSIGEILQVPAEVLPLRDCGGNALESGLPRCCEAFLVTKTGNERFISWSGSLLTGTPADETYFILTGIDNTKRKMAEIELQQSMARYRSLYNNTPVMLHSLDNEGRIINVSDYWLEILYYERIDVIGRKFVEFLAEESRRHIEDIVFPGYLKTGFCKEIPCEVVRKIGGRMDVLISITAERDENGTILRSLAVMIDVTGRKKAQKEIEELNHTLALRAVEVEEAYHELEELNNSLEVRLQEEVANNRKMDFMLIQQSRQAAMGEMIGNIAHQWRQPLNALGLIVQDMQECYEFGEFDDKYLKENVSQAMDVISHMSQTISDFRNFFRPDKILVSFNISDTIHKAVNFVSASFSDQDIEVSVDSEADVYAVGLPNEYSQVVLNILNNAREAIVEREIADARIKIVTCASEGRSLVTITDNAGGIPVEIIDRIFEPYFTTKDSGGTGIGLYMSKTIIEKHMNGKLSVSNNGEGAEFRIEV